MKRKPPVPKPGSRGAERETKFAEAVAEGLDYCQAYVRISPAAAKWKNIALRVRASEMAARPRVQQLIGELRTIAATEAGLRAIDVMEETRRIALSTPAGIIDKATGKILMPHELDAATAAAVSSFEIDDLGRVKYKFWDKNSALERAAKLLGMFKEDNEQSRAAIVDVRRIELVALQPLAPKKGA